MSRFSQRVANTAVSKKTVGKSPYCQIRFHCLTTSLQVKTGGKTQAATDLPFTVSWLLYKAKSLTDG